MLAFTLYLSAGATIAADPGSDLRGARVIEEFQVTDLDKAAKAPDHPPGTQVKARRKPKALQPSD